MPSTALLPSGALDVPPAVLDHDAVPLVYQLGLPFTQSSSAVMKFELLGLEVGEGAGVGDAFPVGDGAGDGDELETGGGGPPPGLEGGVAPPPPPPPQAASETNTAGASSAAESRDRFMQS
jgi:hypothetical protein